MAAYDITSSSSSMPIEKLYFSPANRQRIDPYLPQSNEKTVSTSKPFVTLTYACSLDSQISVSPGIPTALSGLASKSMTHYLRTKHDAILVGSGTAIADDPGLNSRLSDAVDAGLSLQPRPIVLDRRGRWAVDADSRVVKTALAGRGKAPFIVVSQQALEKVPAERGDILQKCGGEYIACDDFPSMLRELYRRDIRSIMVEGGGQIINSLLHNHADLIGAIIVTIAPVYLGSGGVSVRPEKEVDHRSKPAVRLQDVQWLPLENDVVMCARLAKDAMD